MINFSGLLQSATRIYKLLFFLTAISITILSIIPTPLARKAELSGVTFRLDYLFHFIAYFVLVIFFLLWKHRKNSGYKFFVVLFSFGIFFSIIFELIQIFIPSRVFNPVDSLSNLIGFAFGIGSYYLLRKKFIVQEIK